MNSITQNHQDEELLSKVCERNSVKTSDSKE